MGKTDGWRASHQTGILTLHKEDKQKKVIDQETGCPYCAVSNRIYPKVEWKKKVWHEQTHKLLIGL